MEENLTESGVDIGNSESNVVEDLPDDNEIEVMHESDQGGTNETENDKNLDKSLENNSDSN